MALRWGTKFRVGHLCVDVRMAGGVRVAGGVRMAGGVRETADCQKRGKKDQNLKSFVFHEGWIDR